MSKKENDFAKYLSYFFSKYLPGQQNASIHTIASYRDSFKLFLTFWEDEKGCRAETIRLDMITRQSVIGFLDWLEEKRKCLVATRNQRLSALHAFFRYIQRESPENLFEIQKILAIPMKRKPKPVIPYLRVDEMRILLQQPNRLSKSGRRDLVLLAVLYDTAARVSELIGLTYRDIRLDKPAVVRLRGKGRKSRQVPIMGSTRDLLEEYLKSHSASGIAPDDTPVFLNQQKRKLTRRGVSYIINKYVEMARQVPRFNNSATITPHVFRHSKSMHMLQAGINLVYIRDFLGHCSITSTEVYARADSEMKRKALESAYLELDTGELPPWKNDGDLMNWLQNLCK